MTKGESYSRSSLDIGTLDDDGEVSVIRNAEAKCKLGESPLWCRKTNSLFWIDISGKLLFCAHFTEKVLC